MVVGVVAPDPCPRPHNARARVYTHARTHAHTRTRAHAHTHTRTPRRSPHCTISTVCRLPVRPRVSTRCVCSLPAPPSAALIHAPRRRSLRMPTHHQGNGPHWPQPLHRGPTAKLLPPQGCDPACALTAPCHTTRGGCTCTGPKGCRTSTRSAQSCMTASRSKPRPILTRCCQCGVRRSPLCICARTSAHVCVCAGVGGGGGS